MNAVRKHLSAIKGGRLAAAAAPARVVTLAISDVPSDDPAVIGSGPTVPDPHHLRRGPRADRPLRHHPAAAPSPRAWRRTRTRRRTGALPQRRFPHDRHADDGAGSDGRGGARALGLTPLILGDALEGEAARGRHRHGRHRPRSVRAHGHPLRPPAVLLSGGETTVTMCGERRRQRRPQHRVPAGLGDRAGRRARHLGDRRRHRRHRRHGRDRRGAADPRHAGARARPRASMRAPASPAMTAMACSGRSAT